MGKKPTTKIDAVKMTRRIRDVHHEELRGASREERIAFYNGKVRNQQSGRARKPAV